MGLCGSSRLSAENKNPQTAIATDSPGCIKKLPFDKPKISRQTKGQFFVRHRQNSLFLGSLQFCYNQFCGAFYAFGVYFEDVKAVFKRRDIDSFGCIADLGEGVGLHHFAELVNDL